MRVTLSQPLISCTRRMSTPYSSPASMNVKYCSLVSAADLSAPAVVFAVLISSIPPKYAYESCGVCRHRAAAALDGFADEVRNIDDQSHRTVAQDGRAGNSRHRLEIRLEALDDNLLLREKIVDEHTGPLAIGFDDHQQSIGGVPAVGLHAKLIAKLDDGQIFIAQPEHFRAPRQGIEALARNLDGLDDGQQRNDVHLFSDSDQLSVQDGERERQADSNGAAHTLLGGNLHVAAQIVDIPAHHVHSDPASGNIAHLLRGRKTRHENQVVDLLIAQVLILRNQRALSSLLQNLRFIESGAIVAHFDDDVAALMKCRKLERAAFVLAGGETPVGGFQAVIERVADQVHERIADFLEHGLVELSAFA